MHKDFELGIIFRDNMVFQYDLPIRIFGKGVIDTIISVEYLEFKYEFRIDKEDFVFNLPKLPVIENGFSMLFKSRNTQYLIKNILVGEVYIFAGQSNMAFIVDQAINIDIIENKNIRSFEVPKMPYEGAEKDFPWLYQNKSSWLVAEDEKIPYFSAIGYLVARKMNKYLDIPIGIISLNMGDTTVFTWIDEDTQRNNSELKFYYDKYLEEYSKFKTESEYNAYFKQQLNIQMEFYGEIEKGVKDGLDSTIAHEKAFKKYPNPYPPLGPLHQNRPAGLFNTMVKKIIPFNFKAVLYYQGENDKLLHSSYKIAMDALVSNWRNVFDNNFPIIIVQIAGYEYFGVEEYAVPKLRQAQVDFIDLRDQKYLVSASDCGEQFNIHPRDKNVVSERIVNCLREYVYNQTINSLSPVIDNFYIKNNQLIINTKYNRLPLRLIGREKRVFLGKKLDGNVCEIIDFYIDNNKIIINGFEDYQEIDYGFVNYPKLFIYTDNHLPLLPFRIKI